MVLTTPPKLVKAKHRGESTLAEENPLPPSPTCVKQPSPVESTGPASAVAEKVPERANGAPARRQVTHNADKPSNAFIAIPSRSGLSNRAVHASRLVRQEKAELIALEWDL
jgi:hypothetical protein